MIRFNVEATKALHHGNDFQEIDRAIARLGLPMGPFVLFGLVGLRVALHTAETLADAFPDRFEVDDNFRLMGESDLPGVYDWSKGGEVFPLVREGLVVDEGATPLTEEQIQRRALEAIADEARRMLDEGVVADARDIDTAMLLGAGYPFFNGGICMYLDQVGISQELFGRPFVTSVDGART
jgi:3-hydroxyacyl-CoA dehydrogenase